MEESSTYQFKRDKFSRSRGGNPAWMVISCAKCSKAVLLYQKDGPGALVRMYLDRIVAPSLFSELQNKSEVPKGLNCPYCGSHLATLTVYESEDRRAYRLVGGSTSSKKTKDPVDWNDKEKVDTM